MNNEKEIIELNDKELEEVNGGLSQEGIERLAVDVDRDRDAVAFLNPCEDKFATDAVRAAVNARDNESATLR